MNDRTIVKIENVNKKYGDNHVVHNLNIDIKEGEFLTMLGPSGCGKTTTLRMIAGFETPTDGNIFVEGQEIQDTEPYDREVNTVFQNYALFPHMTIFENVAFGLKIKKVPKDEIKKRVLEMLELVQLSGYENRKPDQLSGGQKQRVAIVRALCMHPEILLFDEVTAALDPEMVREVLEVILNLADQGRTMIIVTHEMQFARAVADRIIFLDDGDIKEEGTPDQFFDAPKTDRAKKFLQTFTFERKGSKQN